MYQMKKGVESRKTGFRSKQQTRVYKDLSRQQTLGLRLFLIHLEQTLLG